MPFSLAALKSELGTDPQSLGLKAVDDADAADILNAPRNGNPIWRGVIPAYEIVNATDSAEWTALSAAEKQRYQTLTGAGQVDVSNANVRAAFAAMFGGATATRAALLAMAARQGSRAETLFGANVVITPSQIADAKRS